ncbi:MAG: thioredoxin domain-containing protein [Actinobacteria bacterium]|nr:thioredoxin domain-containing protein [Actinomycetota bacterium]
MENSGQTRSERRATARAERDRAAAARARQRQRLWILGGVLALAAVIVVVIAIAASGGSDNKPAKKAGEALPGQFEANARFAGIPQSGITLGSPRAPVTMVEFADLQCPYCRQYTTQVMPTLVADYVRTGKLKMVFRNVSILGTDSTTAARVAAAAGMQNKLWPFIDIFYANQGEENSGYVTDAFLTRIAAAVRGLDVQKALSDRNLPQVDRLLNEAQTQMTVNGFQGTPSFVIGRTGGRLDALQFNSFTPAPFRQAIDAALHSASSS